MDSFVFLLEHREWATPDYIDTVNTATFSTLEKAEEWMKRGLWFNEKGWFYLTKDAVDPTDMIASTEFIGVYDLKGNKLKNQPERPAHAL